MALSKTQLINVRDRRAVLLSPQARSDRRRGARRDCSLTTGAMTELRRGVVPLANVAGYNMFSLATCTVAVVPPMCSRSIRRCGIEATSGRPTSILVADGEGVRSSIVRTSSRVDADDHACGE